MNIAGFSVNDWFYNKPDICPTGQCKDNQLTAENLVRATNALDVSDTQYNDLLVMYNRELLFLVNMIVGLGVLLFYVYKNQAVFQSVNVLTNQMSSWFRLPLAAATTSAPSATQQKKA